MNIEKYTIEKGIHRVGDYFADLIRKKRTENKVAVMVEDFMTSWFFVEADKNGYPTRRITDFISFIDNPIRSLLDEGADPVADMQSVQKRSLKIVKPLIYYICEYDFPVRRENVFLWEGEIVDTRDVPIEQLDIKQLMKLAQKAIKNREGLIIDEVLKNRLIK